jgi:group II intron reverse transcriptase/maturase
MRARERPQEVITSLNHFIDVEWLREAWRGTRKDGASGIDGVTAAEYEARLEENLVSLHERLKTGTYRPPPVKRVYIPKGDGSKTRPIGIPTFEDKVLQKAVAMPLVAIYEQEFRNCSYGYRPRRGVHDALDALREGLMRMKGGFVIELDIRSFFDSLSHSHLRSFLDLRVRDGVIRRAIGKWLKAGVLENGCFKHSDEGSPQGGVVSPMLANIFLHHVLDVWFEDEIKPRLSGEAFLVRYADDVVIAFAREEDARRVMSVLPKRFGRYGLTLHPDKTRLVRFTRPRLGCDGKGSDDDDWGTFDFLGFTHYWGKTRKGGTAIKQRMASTRMRRVLKAMAAWCKAARHMPVAKQHEKLCEKLRGLDEAYGRQGNLPALSALHHWTERIWRGWLNRRAQRRSMPWDRFHLLLERYPLLRARLSHRAHRLAANP